MMFIDLKLRSLILIWIWISSLTSLPVKMVGLSVEYVLWMSKHEIPGRDVISVDTKLES